MSIAIGFYIIFCLVFAAAIVVSELGPGWGGLKAPHKGKADAQAVRS